MHDIWSKRLIRFAAIFGLVGAVLGSHMAGAGSLAFRPVHAHVLVVGWLSLFDWVIHTKEDLDDYTYYVAGLVGVMLSDIWKWYDGTETDHDLAIGFGRGLQAVNILRNQHEDYAERGVRFIPEGWTRDDVFAYAHENLRLGDLYLQDIKTRTITLFCKIPLALAKRTLKAMEDGKDKMSRQEVEEVVAEVKNE